jgi:hypothetical protein
MDVQVGLLIFAANVNNPMNSYILLQEVSKDENDYLKIPSAPLPDDLDSVSLVYRIIKECSGVTGKWIEMTPKQVGVFDDVNRNPKVREIFIGYSLYIPEPMKVYSGYKWIKLDEFTDKNLYLDTEQIIRYTILGGDKYVF